MTLPRAESEKVTPECLFRMSTAHPRSGFEAGVGCIRSISAAMATSFTPVSRVELRFAKTPTVNELASETRRAVTAKIVEPRELLLFESFAVLSSAPSVIIPLVSRRKAQRTPVMGDDGSHVITSAFRRSCSADGLLKYLDAQRRRDSTGRPICET